METLQEGTGLNVVTPSPDGTLLFLSRTVHLNVRKGWGAGFAEYVRVHPVDGPDETMARVAGERLPQRIPNLVVSPDGQHLATLLIDGATTNIWTMPTACGALRPLTDFGDRYILMVRNVSWSPDSRHIYAAVAERQTDVVLLDGLI